MGDVSPWSEGTKGARGFTFKSNNGHVAAHSVHTNIVTKALGPSRAAAVHLIPGYYNVSLTPKLVASHKLRPAAYVDIDCDLYVSTYGALDFMLEHKLIVARQSSNYDIRTSWIRWGPPPPAPLKKAASCNFTILIVQDTVVMVE